MLRRVHDTTHRRQAPSPWNVLWSVAEAPAAMRKTRLFADESDLYSPTTPPETTKATLQACWAPLRLQRSSNG
jgi:hypothetical protein